MKTYKLFAVVVLCCVVIIAQGCGDSNSRRSKISRSRELVNDYNDDSETNIDELPWNSFDSIPGNDTINIKNFLSLFGRIELSCSAFRIVITQKSANIFYNDWIVNKPTGLVEPNEMGDECVMDIKRFYNSAEDGVSRAFPDNIITLQTSFIRKIPRSQADTLINLIGRMLIGNDKAVERVEPIDVLWKELFIVSDDDWERDGYKDSDEGYALLCRVYINGMCFTSPFWPYCKSRFVNGFGRITPVYTPLYERLRTLILGIRNGNAPRDYLKFDPDHSVYFYKDSPCDSLNSSPELWARMDMKRQLVDTVPVPEDFEMTLHYSYKHIINSRYDIYCDFILDKSHQSAIIKTIQGERILNMNIDPEDADALRKCIYLICYLKNYSDEANVEKVVEHEPFVVVEARYNGKEVSDTIPPIMNFAIFDTGYSCVIKRINDILHEYIGRYQNLFNGLPGK